jgi:hypothetical protein
MNITTGTWCAGEVEMGPRWWIVIAVACVSLAPAPGQDKQGKDQKKVGPIKVEITGVLLQAGEKPGSWAIKVSPDGGAAFSWPVDFSHAEKGGELEKTAQRLRNQSVVLTGELVYIPPFTDKSPLSRSPPATFPAIALVLARAIREAEKR